MARKTYLGGIVIFCVSSLLGTLFVVGRTFYGRLPAAPDVNSAGLPVSVAQLFLRPPQNEGGGGSHSLIVHPSEEPAPQPGEPEALIKAKLGECTSESPFHFALPEPLHDWLNGKPKNEPMSIKNVRHSPLTVQMEPAMSNKHGRWVIAPGVVWKTTTRSGQRWLFADGKRCLFYVTVGDEALRMVVKSQKTP